MDTAFCLADGKAWDADELRKEAKKHPDQWLIDRRQTFICRGCEEKARFINYNGKRIAHFGIVRGSQHHEDCDFLGDPTGGLRNNGAGGQLPVRPPAAGNKTIRYDAPGPLNPSAAGGNGGNNNGGNGGNPNAGVAPLQPTTGLQTLLKNLRNGPDYPPANLWLDIPARGTGVGSAVRAADYFFKIADVASQTPHQGGTRAFWGVITNVTDDGDGKYLWINCDAKGHLLTIRVDPGLKAELIQRLGIERIWDLYGAHVIVEGVMGGSRKIRIDVTDLKKISFLPKR